MVGVILLFIKKTDKCNNTDYIEFQICHSKLDEKLESLVKVQNISINVESSLYIDFMDYEKFMQEYGIYFNNGVHSDMKESEFDPYGINYFSLDKTMKIIELISKDKPYEFEKIIVFLLDAKDNNGFYILGI